MLALSLLALTLVAFRIPILVSTSQFGNLFVSGFLGLVFGDSFLFKSYEYNGPRVSSLIMSTAPAIAAILAYFFLHESLTGWALCGMSVTLVGIGLVVSGRGETASKFPTISARGVFFAFLGACGQGGGLVTAKLAFNEGPINGLSATSIRIISALLFLIPITILTRRFLSPWGLYARDRRGFLYTLVGAVLGPYFGITFSLIAVSHCEVAIAATLMATVPILMLPLLKFVYSESLSWRAYAGAFVAVAGVAILFLF